eukprot:COSAG05_NODE_14215_length_404_cov_0.783607_1_plen_63_part_01
MGGHGHDEAPAAAPAETPEAEIPSQTAALPAAAATGLIGMATMSSGTRPFSFVPKIREGGGPL